MRALAAAALLLLCAAAAGAQPAPYHRWRTLETLHFRVHAPQGLEREARAAAAAAERAYAALARELVAPRGLIELVVSDDADYSNGFATPVPSNRIVVFAAPPVESGALRFNDDWLATVITHELAHIFHLDRSRGAWALAQRVFGRAPHLFPNTYGPSWLTEGLAVYYESRLTGAGRLKGAEHPGIARAAAADRALPRLDQLGLANPHFPGGEGTYAYGALFLQYLADARGDASVPRFVESQSGTLVPYLIDRPARRGFGVALETAFDAWRDSLARAAGAAPAVVLPSWRELTAHPYFALAPRWRDDSSLVYVGGDGRSTNAAWSVALDGTRERLGRRNARSANVPLRSGGLLYAQPEFTSTSEVRSDLWIARGGRERRLTRDARLVQPDARAADGAIVAVRLEPARTSLVLLDSAGVFVRVLRQAGADETWSEPRWSPDGASIAAVHRAHGGVYSIAVLDTLGRAREYDVARATRSSPAWAPRGDTLYYVADDGRAQQLVRLALGAAFATRSVITGQTAQRGLFTPEPSPSGALLAAASLRADGYHLGVAPLAPLAAGSTAGVTPAPARADSAPVLAEGDFRRYSPWRTLVPRYWYPVIEAAPGRGTRLGFTTSGNDAVGRHRYAAAGAVPTTGRYPVGSLAYRYAGLRRPFVDVGLSQDVRAEAALLNGGTTNIVGSLVRSVRDASLTASFVRPRVRSFSSLTAGAGVEGRSFHADPGEFLKQLDTAFQRGYLFPRVLAGASWSRLQRPALSISPEDGVSLGITLRQRWRSDLARRTASASAVGTAAAYKSLDLGGFAHHVIAVRAAGGIADRRASAPLEVGGTSGSVVEIAPGYTVGEGRRTFGVRGFPTGAVFGTRAAAGSVEYRAPLLLGGRGLRLLPVFFDRSSLTVFADAGVATCAESPLYASTCARPGRIGRTIASAGAELGLSAALLSWDSPQAIRIGVAAPVAGRALSSRAVSPYLAFGLSF